MPIMLKLAISIAFTLALYLIAEKFIPPKRYAKVGCFFSLLAVQLLFMLFIPENPGITEFATLFCGGIISLYIYVECKNYSKSIDTALSIVLVFVIFAYTIGLALRFIFPIFVSLDENANEIVNSFIAQVCVIAFGFLLRKYKNYFLKQAEYEKLLQFHVALKILLFIVLCIATPFLFADSDLYPVIMLSVTATVVIVFFLVKYTTKLIMESANKNRIMAIEFNKLKAEAESTNKRRAEIVEFKHYYTSLYRSILHYICEKDLQGLEDYYKNNITPIHEQLRKEIDDYDQVKYIHIVTLKARIVELINTVSQLPNVELSLYLYGEVNHVSILEIDLYKIISILIDNAVEETINHEKGEIIIDMGQTEVSFFFQIKNTIKGQKSTPKPNNTHKGLSIIREIQNKYRTVDCMPDLEYGYYVQKLVIKND